MNTRQIIEVLKRRIKSGVMMLGASLTVRARAFGDGPEMVQTAPSALLSRFAHSGSACLMS